MQARPLPLSTKIVLWFVAIVALAMFFLPGESVSYMKYNSATAQCRANLKRISVDILAYQAKHAGKMPPSLKVLYPTVVSQLILVCPDSGFVNGKEVSYDYRPLSKPSNTDAICWDSHPQQRWQTYFVWLNRPNRNVLCADGQVKNLPEAEFQRLHLSGQSWVVQ